VPGTDQLEMVPYDGGVTFHLNGKTLLEAIYAVGGLEARFARDSGVESHFVLTGANDARGYSLTGRGTISNSRDGCVANSSGASGRLKS
jgi:hypothetical protein